MVDCSTAGIVACSISALRPETSLYFFSALFQGNASLLAIGAVFVVFKIQTLQQEVMLIRNFLVSSESGLKPNFTGVYYFQFADQQKREQIIKENKSISGYLRRWNKSEKQMKEIGEFTKRSIIFFSCIIGLSIFGIIFSSFLNCYSWLVSFGIFNVVGLVYLAKNIIDVMNDGGIQSES